jgi:hypothetical protein
MAEVRALNEAGLRWFGDYLTALRNGQAPDRDPEAVIYDPAHTIPFRGQATVELREFSCKMEATSYLQQVLSPLDRSEVDHNSGLWSWLALFYVRQLCPLRPVGTRSVGENHRYILAAPGTVEHHRHYYRHLLAGPCRIFRLHGSNARLFLQGPVSVHGDISEQVASRQELITNRGFIQALDDLYFDRTIGGPKKGYTNRKKPGTLRRLLAIMEQLDCTYDLYGMSGLEIVALLPVEFSFWKGKRQRWTGQLGRLFSRPSNGGSRPEAQPEAPRP